MRRLRIDTPRLRSGWQPARADPSPSDDANAYSGYDLSNDVTGEVTPLSRADLVRVRADDALDLAEEALIRLDSRDVLDLLRAATRPATRAATRTCSSAGVSRAEPPPETLLIGKPAVPAPAHRRGRDGESGPTR